MGSRSTTADALLALLLAASLLVPRSARAQTKEELRAARELFQEAFKDEEEKRYADALEKFRRVAKVKESASVRYRIAAVLAAMGRLRESRDLFRALAASRPSLPTNDFETADAAAERAAEMDRRIPRLSLRIAEPVPEGARVTVDGAPMPVSSAPRTFEVDPGVHVVAASAPGASSPPRTIQFADGGGEVEYTIAFAADASAGVSPAANADHPNRTLGWIAVGGGVVLVVSGVALLVARESAIGHIEDTCPGNVCPTATRGDVEGDRDRAELFGPLGVGLGVLGLAAAGVGTYLLLVKGPAAAQASRPFTLRF